MPILAVLTGTPDDPQPVPTPDLRRLEFRSLDGQDVLPWTGSEWIIQSGIQGLRLPPQEVITEQVQGLDGARLREVRTNIREIVIPFFVTTSSDDYAVHLDQLDLLHDLLDHRGVDCALSEGTFDLVGITGRGERFVRCVYVDGMEGVDGVGSGNGRTWSTFDGKFRAVDPYARGAEWSTPVVSLPSSSPFLSDAPVNAWPRKLGATVALGANMPVRVGGNIPSPAVIEIVGPAATTHVTSPQGLNVQVGAITAGQTLLIDSGRSPGRRRRITLNGVPAGALVADPLIWAPLPPGDALISVELTGATSATSARIYGTELWRSLW